MRDGLGALLALASAFVWGSGDFCGGLATRRTGPLLVLGVSTLAGLLGLVAVALLVREPLPPAASVIWAVAAGLSGMVGILSLYQALSMGHAANVAPTSAVIGVAMLALYGLATAGWPGWGRLIGFGLAALGIWLVSRSTATDDHLARRALALAVVAGLGFGGYFILMGLVEPGLYFTPVICARLASLSVAGALMRLRRLRWPSLASNPVAWLAGLLDTGGNVLYLAARQFTRLDVAGVLSSLYPVSTVLLAWLILHQRLSRQQWLGAAVCMAAVVLITR
jgi:drug/metabolite transporter (DMT)-like permease